MCVCVCVCVYLKRGTTFQMTVKRDSGEMCVCVCVCGVWCVPEAWHHLPDDGEERLRGDVVCVCVCVCVCT